MKKRIAPRKPLQTRVVFQDEFGDAFLYFISDNISSSGIFIQTSLPLRPGTKVLLKFSLYEGLEPIEVSAEVIRFQDKRRGPGRHRPITKGIGLKFLGLSTEDFQKIENFVQA